jgi:hypothetical protein
VRRDKTAVRQLVGLEDVMEKPLAAGMMKSVELSPTSSTGEGGVTPPRKRLHERTASDTADVILDLESPGKASRRSSSLRPLGAQVLGHSVSCSSSQMVSCVNPKRCRTAGLCIADPPLMQSLFFGPDLGMQDTEVSYCKGLTAYAGRATILIHKITMMQGNRNVR